MYCIDFMAVENAARDSSRSGDAIVVATSIPGRDEPALIVIDGGFTETGNEVVEHIERHYGVRKVDLVISTHPDTDHLNGLIPVIEKLGAREIMMHIPWEHASGTKWLGNIDKVEQLYQLAVKKQIPVIEPFTGESALQGSIQILGPTREYYKEQLEAAVDDAITGIEEQRYSKKGGIVEYALAHARSIFERVIEQLPTETLDDTDDTGPRNKTSVVTLLHTSEKQAIFTGDSGIEGLSLAIDQYETLVGSISIAPPGIFQVPHHGSKHNLGPTILNRMFGSPGQTTHTLRAVISSAKSSVKHPSPKVTNALQRRGISTYATEGMSMSFHSTGHGHAGWDTPLTPIPIVPEDE